MTLHSELIKLWPSADEVENCIKGDAEAASPEVLLAVHQTMELRRREVGSSVAGEKCREEDLLEALMVRSGDGRVIVPVVGTSGVGKSHVVRWLFARLSQLPEASRPVVIRIPRNTSLKGVLEILLGHESLKGQRYEVYRRGLSKAQEELNPLNASNLLCEMLAQELVRVGENAKQALNQGRNDRILRLQADYGRANFLPALLRHPVLRDRHWLGPTDGSAPGPVRLLIEQLVISGAPQDDDDRKHSFAPEDLEIVDLGERDVGHEAAKMLGLLRRLETREFAAQALNSVIDSAKSSILRMDPTVNKMFEDIRAGLLHEKKELVLLIEDFATTAGLQAQLVQAMLKEGVRDGEPVICTMRTALAYTPGSFDPPDTFKTRAGAEWYVIDDAWTPSELSRRTRNMVGAYLNAARVGVNQLRQAAAGAKALGDRKWIPSAEALEGEVSLVLEDFGTSDDGYSLFPFNAAAIDKWLSEGSIREGKVVYNPRFIIKNILRKVLLWRPSYEGGYFPPPDLASSQLRPVEEEKLQIFISAKGWEKDYARYRILFGYWLGDARSFAVAKARADRVMRAFDLPWEKGSERFSPPPKESDPRQPNTALPSLPTTPTTPESPKWQRDLEEWRSNVELPQDTSRHLRALLLKALVEAEPPEWFLTRRNVPDRWAQEIWIPRSFGVDIRKEDDAATAVCSNKEYSQPLKRAAIAASLRAFFRFEAHGRSWNYDGADEDLPRYCGLVSQMLPRFRRFLAERPLEVTWDPLPTIVSGLLLGGKGLGIERASSTRTEELIAALFEPTTPLATPRSAGGEASAWSKLQETFRELRSAEVAGSSTSWRLLLLDLVGARQGTGKAVHALDVARLKPALDGVLSTGAFVKPQVDASSVSVQGVRIHKYISDGERTLSLNKMDKAIEEECARVAKWRVGAEASFGTELDGPAKDRIADTLRKTIDCAQVAGYCTVPRARSLHDQVTKFQGAQVVEALRSATILAQASKRPDRLRELGKSQESTRLALDAVAGAFAEFFGEVEEKARAVEGTIGPDPMGQALADIKSELADWITALKADA